MQTTTQQKLYRAFVNAIQGITSSYLSIDLVTGAETPLYRDALWTYVECGRDAGRAEGLAGQGLRSFTLIFGPAAPNGLWFSDGEAYGATLSIAVSYADVPAQDLEGFIASDGIDLRATLIDLLDPTVPGLGGVEYQGFVNANMDDAGNIYGEHLVDICWNQQTNA